MKIERIHIDLKAAKLVGTNKAILLDYIAYWCAINERNGTNEVEGEYWVWNTIEDFGEVLCDSAQRTIRRFLTELEQAGFIKSGIFHSDKRNRTKWYTVTDKYLRIIGNNTRDFYTKLGMMQVAKNDNMDVAKNDNMDVANSAVCNIKEEDNTKDNTKDNTLKKEIDLDFEKLWIDYEKIGTKVLALKNWNKLSTDEKKEVQDSVPNCLKGTTHTDGAQSRVGKFKPFRQHLATYLNKANRHWEKYLDETESATSELPALEVERTKLEHIIKTKRIHLIDWDNSPDGIATLNEYSQVKLKIEKSK